MRTTRIIITSLAAVLSAAAVAGPAAAAPTDPAVSPPVAQKAPTWPINPQPIAQHSMAATATSSGFDWGSAVIGAAVVGTFAIALAGSTVLLRRRHGRSTSVTTT